MNGVVDTMWFDARSYCMSEGGDLASIHNDEEKNFIYDMVSFLVSQIWSIPGVKISWFRDVFGPVYN